MTKQSKPSARCAALGFDCFVMGSDTHVYSQALAQGIGALRATLDRESP